MALLDSYSEANQDWGYELHSEGIQQAGQAITLAAATINSVKFYIKKSGSPTGNCIVRLYAATGTVGSTAVPTGSPLASTGVLDVATLTTSLALHEFTFASPYAAPSGKYCILIEYTGGDVTNFLYVGADISAPTHPGNGFYTLTPGSDYVANATYDACFYLYGTFTPPKRTLFFGANF